jgi:hypothetical protein
MTQMYEVLADELTLLKQVGVLTDPITGRELGIQQGAGKIYLKGETVPESVISPNLLAALNDEDHPSHASAVRKLKKAESEEEKVALARRLALPFEGYDEMSDDDILAAMVVLPSSTIQRIKEYEGEHEGREKIMLYNIGFGEGPTDRLEGNAGSQLDEEASGDDTKAVSKLTTRNVDGSDVTIGDGITGTGDPQIPHGSRSEEEEGEDGEKKPAARRRSRRARPANKQAQDKPAEGGDDE